MSSIREQLEAREQETLSPNAALSLNTKGRAKPEPPDPLRTCYQVDRDRILQSKAFRRLKGKTQVFLAPVGDHYRTRMTHTLEVSQVARTISKSLRLNEDITEAIALGHDLGHTPFGHSGEDILKKLHPESFYHPFQSIRIVEELEKDGEGLNLTHEVRDGIAKHSKGRGPILTHNPRLLAETWEGQIVRLADIIAYASHDVDDAIRANVFQYNDIPKEIRDVLGNSYEKRFQTMCTDVVEATINGDGSRILMSEKVLQAINDLRAFLFAQVYESDRVKSEFDKAERILASLYTYFKEHPEELKKEMGNHFFDRYPLERNICDFIAGMTDQYALDLYQELFIPKPWKRR
ncbi:MAG TPA: deoxyguanosinetriphosphate triphosphohydrolase [Bdellovibrionota bacterium]|nr:deoxyguanosinetriphosphate triphosphohydrolase [Bdellovibrionota bacterium]